MSLTRTALEPLSIYDSLLRKPPDTIVRELEQVIGAAKITMAEASRWLIDQKAPKGPIMRERDVSLVYKCIWGGYAAGMERDYIAEMLDWLYSNSLQPNGDFFFPEEPADHRVDSRAYRALLFLKYAALMDHPMIRDEKVMKRIRQYQDTATGGCFYYIGENPANPVWPDFIDVGNTAFFGELCLALDLRNEALRAGAWMLKLVQDNGVHMSGEGTFYCLTDRQGQLVTDVKPGEVIFKTVNNRDSNQMGWNIGCCMAFLADLYHAMREKWAYKTEDSRPYLDAALRLTDFENSMPLVTYFYPSKCKVIWGAAALLGVLLKHGLGSETEFDKLYRICKRVFLFTFLGTQLPEGGWPGLHYPLRDDAPELQFDYRVLKGLTLYPREQIVGSSSSSYLPPTEVTGEILGEIGAMVEGLSPLIEHYRQR